MWQTLRRTVLRPDAAAALTAEFRPRRVAPRPEGCVGQAGGNLIVSHLSIALPDGGPRSPCEAFLG